VITNEKIFAFRFSVGLSINSFLENIEVLAINLIMSQNNATIIMRKFNVCKLLRYNSSIDVKTNNTCPPFLIKKSVNTFVWLLLASKTSGALLGSRSVLGGMTLAAPCNS
jgi:hypothetical protein